MSKRAKKTEETNGTAHTNGADTPRPACVPPGSTKKHRFSQSLPVKLSEEKRAELQSRLSALTCERVAEEGRLAVSKETIKGLAKREDAIAEQLNEGAEETQVECVEYLTATNEILVVRLDTGEVVSTRVADSDDLQQDIPGTGQDTEPPPSEPDVGPREGDIEGELLSVDRPS